MTDDTSAPLVRAVPELVSRARENTYSDPHLSALVLQARTEGLDEEWLTDNLSVRLSAMWGCTDDFSEVVDAVRVIAREALMAEGPLVVLPTGQTLQLPKEALYQPPGLVPRESGNMVQPLPRLHPMVEGDLIQIAHDMARERSLTAGALERLPPTTPLVVEEGARPLDIITRRGREGMTERIRAALLPRFLEDGGGPVTAFAGALSFQKDRIEPAERVFCQTVSHIPDKTALNLRHDFQERLLLVLLGELNRRVAGMVVDRMGDRIGRHTGLAEGVPDLAGTACWLVPPQHVFHVRHRLRCAALPVDGEMAFSLTVDSVRLWADPATYDVRGSDMGDRLDIRAGIVVGMQVDVDRIQVFRLPLLPEEHSEVVR